MFIHYDNKNFLDEYRNLVGIEAQDQVKEKKKNAKRYI